MAKIKPNSETLFPILNAVPTGLARLAAEAAHTADGHLIEFKAIKSRSILNRSISKRRLSIAWSINPYRGCEFACRYCFARYTHEFLEPGPLGSSDGDPDAIQPWATAFERHIFLKQNAAWLLEQELRKLDRTDPLGEIVIGTATDPYQPIERTARITRSLLEVLARRSGRRLGIITKSTLIARDIDLLTEIARRNTLVLHITVTTPDARLARILEPRAPRPDLRLATVRRLREAGLITGILCSPLLPGITDTAEAIDRMAAHAAKADASFFAANPLYLKSCSRPTFQSFVREHYPHLAVEYAERFAQRAFAEKPYQERLQALVQESCQRHRVGERSGEVMILRAVGENKKPPTGIGIPIQTKLFG
ncbi:radical SAM protein [Granulicella sp. WH15]|uniref:SPL family radical SAM protein n=1 Tax=Granulicella sp. WH15 TaxID=2602070 RepID=UPI0013673ECB|nr:radical SAM protein [Granulicella sp. WH15]QHN02405.1 radical SAM protein [Granulicella sp. WH15]